MPTEPTEPTMPVTEDDDSLESYHALIRPALPPRVEPRTEPEAPVQDKSPPRQRRGPSRRSIERLWDNYNFLSDCAARAQYLASLPVVPSEKPRAGASGQVQMTLTPGGYGYTPFTFVFGALGAWLPLTLGPLQKRLADVSFERWTLPRALRWPDRVVVEVYVRGNRVLHVGLLLRERRQVVSLFGFDVLVSEPRQLWKGKGHRCLYFVSPDLQPWRWR